MSWYVFRYKKKLSEIIKLDKVKTSDAEQFNIRCSRRFKEMGLYKGRIVNIDRHFMGYFGKKRIGKDKHPTRNIRMKGVNASFTHDRETCDPIFVRADSIKTV